MYCGNNRVNEGLLNGSKTLGTRYTCLKRGIGIGLHLPYDREYNGNYEPLYDEKIYCGNQENLPAGYDRFGSLSQCQARGVGVGKKLRAERGYAFRGPRKNKYIQMGIIVLIPIAVFLILYLNKPSYITQIDKKTKKVKIAWGKFFIYFLTISVVIEIVLYLFWKWYISR